MEKLRAMRGWSRKETMPNALILKTKHSQGMKKTVIKRQYGPQRYFPLYSLGVMPVAFLNTLVKCWGYWKPRL